jgi:hypothetical protein
MISQARLARRATRRVPLLVPALWIVACGADDPSAPGDGGDPGGSGGDPPSSVGLVLTEIVGGLHRPVHLTAPSGDPRLFVVEKTGRIRIVEDGSPRPTPFLDLTGAVAGGSEQGLLSLAFHPDYPDTGAFFVNYTHLDGDTRIVRYRVSGDPNLADAASGSVVMSIEQPFSNHNGGHLVFGPDGMLYVGVGDGGSAGDPQGNGQNRATRLGSILRIDVDAGDPFAVPPDNPFVGDPSALPEIWLWGLRNPWRIAFDESTSNLFVADVGQSQREEVTVVGSDEAGANLGWNVTEGTRCFAEPDCTPEDYTLPQVEYGHDDGCSITGGLVYRGPIEQMWGLYFYSDYCGGWLRSFRIAGGAAAELTEWDVPRVGNVTSFGEDAGGELYVLTESAVYRIDPAAADS